MAKKKNAEPTIFEIDRLLHAIELAMQSPDVDQDTLHGMVSSLSDHHVELAKPRYAGHQRHLTTINAAIVTGRKKQALEHLRAMRQIVRPTANDKPFHVKDQVAVVRTKHGWHDGQLEGVVSSRHQAEDGTWQYEVTDKDGEVHEVKHTRDLHPNSQ